MSMKVYTYLLEDEEGTIVTVRAENACIADSIVAEKHPNMKFECIEWEDDDW